MKIVFLMVPLFLVPVFSMNDQFITVKDAKAKWGTEKFEAEKFKSFKPTPFKRAPMAVDLLNSQELRGKKMGDIRTLLGDPDGYFFSDTILAYKIQTQKETPKESWQMVIIPDEDLLNVKEIKIHKRCCGN